MPDPYYDRTKRTKRAGGEAVGDVFRFDPLPLPPECETLRREVRAFLAEERAAGSWGPSSDFAQSHSPEFSRRLAKRGWIGLTWPKKYGGAGERLPPPCA